MEQSPGGAIQLPDVTSSSVKPDSKDGNRNSTWRAVPQEAKVEVRTRRRRASVGQQWMTGRKEWCPGRYKANYHPGKTGQPLEPATFLEGRGSRSVLVYPSTPCPIKTLIETDKSTFLWFRFPIFPWGFHDGGTLRPRTPAKEREIKRTLKGYLDPEGRRRRNRDSTKGKKKKSRPEWKKRGTYDIK
ncbi:hypothetical protein NDU88_007987 [Pleurodeles waltl]|uniref:Uncharacterized protein n=1 Tax=Pleurodeles waltl TaxID=8319 RepID=A0AAV7N585_PLEWA|nr:hypothetical protein NDU88_007987 [Pleurodeles waltl]